MTKNTQPKHDDQDRTAEGRKAYQSPKLVMYGNVREFTRGGGKTTADKAGFLSQ